MRQAKKDPGSNLTTLRKNRNYSANYLRRSNRMILYMDGSMCSKREKSNLKRGSMTP